MLERIVRAQKFEVGCKANHLVLLIDQPTAKIDFAIGRLGLKNYTALSHPCFVVEITGKLG